MHSPYLPTWAPRTYPAYHPRAVTPRVTVELGDLSWVGTPHQGTCFLLRSLTGWWAGGTPTGGPESWDNADGGYLAATYLGGRVVTLRGLILTESGADQFDAFDELAAVFATTRERYLTVSEPERGLSRRLLVTPRDIPDPQPITDKMASVSMVVGSAEWPLTAATGSTATITTGGVACVNEGTTAAAMTLSLVGPLTNPGLSWSGGAWQYTGTIASGTTLTVDLRGRKVRNGATSQDLRVNAAGTWLQLPPGSTTISRTGTGAGSITASWRSSWA